MRSSSAAIHAAAVYQGHDILIRELALPVVRVNVGARQHPSAVFLARCIDMFVGVRER